ncbi:hypothetical protein L210DRAFT_3550392 [Boletus edulis BED1]|uniref:Uncharacterized protein n=1 Tax=Boletus edulis BED1 TaxID=1328754 RepID=A0AAD4BBI8_BOLED|nr:hypothetical protein L210DRAFT_3584566 [Boletus edulis BED1]KAF8435692.1 hypothetical protein L210DRAFT_3550392 [Boletus edulis BED1]
MSFPPTNLDLGHADIDENVSDAILTLVVSHMGHAVRTTTQDRSNGRARQKGKQNAGTWCTLAYPYL